MTFGERVRKLRQQKNWTLRDLAAEVHVGFTYRLADALEVDEEELLILAKRLPE